MDGKKVYQIQINGVKESIDAIDALNKQLDELERRINALQAKSVNIGSVLNGSGAKATSKASLSEEDKLLKNIEQTEKKIETYSKSIYQNYLAAKDVLRETLNDQKQIAAQERLQANTYTNTMAGLKSKLADIKQVMQTTDIGSDIFKKYTKEANEITLKLKELEEAYGQFGRNVGNYKSAAEGFEKIKVAVGDTIREYDNYRQAAKALKQERFQLAQSVGQEAQAYKDVDIALKKLESDYQDLSKSSAVMDNILDTMQGLTAIASIGVGIQSLFGIDDSTFNETMQKLTSLLVILKGIEAIQLQMQTNQGYIAKGLNKFSKAISDSFKGWYVVVSSAVSYFTKNTKYVDRLNESMLKTNKVVKILSKSFKTLFSFGFIMALPEILEWFTELIKSFDKTKHAAEEATRSLNAFNREIEYRKDELGANYLKGVINDEEYLKGVYDAQTDSLIKQIDTLETRASKLKNEYHDITDILNTFSATKNTEFSGKKFTGETTVGHGRFDANVSLFGDNTKNDFEWTVKSIKEVEEAWKKCNEAVKEGKDYFDKWGEGFKDWWSSLTVTVKDTEEVMRGMGNIRLSDFIASFGEVNKQFKSGKISSEQYAAELKRLQKEMNSNEVLNSVIANLDKYIPDDDVREAVQKIIDEITRLDDAFNMTSAQQVHHWEQVRIDAMKDGWEKTKAQIENNRRYELKETALTEEQKQLVNAKYHRQYLDAQEKYNKEAADKAKAARDKQTAAENQLIALRIENMKDGLKKQLAELDNQRRLELQKVKDNGIKVGELSLEINKKYDQKILEEKRKWAFETLKIYEDLANKIEQVNKGTFEKETNTASKNTQTKAAKQQQDTGYSMINPTNYDDTKAFEEYYKKLVDIKKAAAERELAIEKEKLDKEAEYEKREEEIRHSRLVNTDGGEYIKQLRAGLITQEQYDKLIEDENDAHYARMNVIDNEYASNLSASTQSTLEEVQKLYSDYYGNIINGIRKDKSKVDEIMSKQPVTDTAGWGVVNIGKSSDNYDKALQSYDDLKNKIIQKQKELDAALKAKTISAEDFAIRKTDLDNEMKAIDDAVKNVEQRQKELIADFMQSIQMYIQAATQSFSQIMQAVWDAQDVAFDKEQDDIDKMNDMLEKALDKQNELYEEHKSNVDSLEEELANSRGSRRQHLIDQINAEIAAERAAAKEKKKIEKEQEKQQKKQDELDKKRKKAQYKRDMLQAVVNGALAVTMAAVNAWPIPAIPMMALAAATTAAEIAIMASNKPYAKGGQLDGGKAVGNRHRDGGIKVLGGRAEIEGGEFITNRITTEKNIDILEYINDKHKKLDLDDFIDFYSSGKTRKTISSTSPRRVFADGGVIPTMRNDYDINDKLLTAFEAYNDRPVVVSVVDINNRQKEVRNVRVLAGLDD